MNWNDITLKQFYEIRSLLSVDDEWTALNIIDYLYNVDSQALPFSELKKFDISFIKEPISTAELEKYYILNGRKYISNFDITKVTVAQFIDYQNYIREDEVKLEKLLSVFFIPDGYKDYNSGYDIVQLQDDLLELPIPVAQEFGFFLGRQFKILFRLFRYYLVKEVKKLKMEKTKKKEMIANLQKLDFWDLVSYPTYLNIVKSQMKQ